MKTTKIKWVYIVHTNIAFYAMQSLKLWATYIILLKLPDFISPFRYIYVILHNHIMLAQSEYDHWYFIIKCEWTEQMQIKITISMFWSLCRNLISILFSFFQIWNSDFIIIYFSAFLCAGKSSLNFLMVELSIKK